MSLIIPLDTIKKLGIDTTGVRHSEPKNYTEGYLSPTDAAEWYFKTMSPKPPSEVGMNGLNPADRSEVNLRGTAGGGFEAFKFGKELKHKFIFAFPSKTLDGTASKSLKALGWLPGKAGESSYMYLFRMAAGDPYISTGARVSASSEIAFPDWLVPTDFVAAYLYNFGDTVGAPVPYQALRLTPSGW